MVFNYSSILKNKTQVAIPHHWDRPDWPQIKNKVWINAPTKACWICGKLFDLQFHHISYLRVGMMDEWQDIVIVCRLHHRLCHNDIWGKIPLTDKALTKRYKYLVRAKWRRLRPSDFFNWILAAYDV